MTLYYISFARPISQGGFIGATVVEADSALNAIRVARWHGVDPGGEAAVIEVPAEAEGEARQFLDRLVGEEELRAFGYYKVSELSEEIRDASREDFTFVGQDRNDRTD